MALKPIISGPLLKRSIGFLPLFAINTCKYLKKAFGRNNFCATFQFDNIKHISQVSSSVKSVS